MDEFYSENFYDFNAESNLPDWNEKQWHEYLKKSDNEVLRFASAYTVHKLKGLKLVEIANILGWNFPEDDDEENEDENSADFSDEPWTLLNHPVYIITRALFKNLREYIGNLITETSPNSELAWSLASAISEASTYMTNGVSCIDMGEDILARCNYKTAMLHLNTVLAKLSNMPEPTSEAGVERLRRANMIVFDLRQLCLDLSRKTTKKRI